MYYEIIKENQIIGQKEKLEKLIEFSWQLKIQHIEYITHKNIEGQETDIERKIIAEKTIEQELYDRALTANNEYANITSDLDTDKWKQKYTNILTDYIEEIQQDMPNINWDDKAETTLKEIFRECFTG